MKCDIAILGGGIIGSSIAWHLTADGRAGNVVVIERDPTYEYAATPRGNGGIRQLFSLPENIAMAQYGLDFYGNFSDRMPSASDLGSIGFTRQGYLFISDRGGAEQMIANQAVQEAHGVNAQLLDGAGVRRHFASLNTDDIAVAVYSPDDAWIDPYAALMGFRTAAAHQGCDFVKGDIADWEVGGAGGGKVLLADGRQIEAGTFVLSCGAWSAEIAAHVGLELPIEPMSRESYFFKAGTELEPLPFLKSESDLAIRPEGTGYVGGCPNWQEAVGWNFELSDKWFNEVVWPALAQRVPAMETLKLERSWRGHYARNTLDYSPIIGRWLGGSENVVIASGFSGHGIMHAPATGRAVSELLLDGGFQTIDITRFGYGRIPNNAPMKEIGIV